MLFDLSLAVEIRIQYDRSSKQKCFRVTIFDEKYLVELASYCDS